MLSPFMPFITEEMWHAVYDGKPPAKSIALARYPLADPAQINAEAETEMAILQDLIVAVRNIRAELKVEPKAKLPIEIFAEPACACVARSQPRRPWSGWRTSKASPSSSSHWPKGWSAQHGALRRPRDLRAQDRCRRRTRAPDQRADKMTGELARGTAQLNNEAFLSKAPANVVEGLRKRKAEVEMLVDKTNAALGELSAQK